MLQINQFLSRFKNIKNTEQEKKSIVLEILIKNGIPATIKQVVISKNTILFKVQPIIKTEILLKKEVILLQIKKNHCFNNITNLL